MRNERVLGYALASISISRKQKQHMRRTRTILFSTFGLLILLIGIPLLMTYREAIRLQRNRELIHAIRQKDLIDVQILLHQGADPNTKEFPEVRRTFLQQLFALFDPYRHGPPKLLFSAPPSALMLAVAKDNTPITLALLHGGATDVNAKIDRSWDDSIQFSPPIVLAAENGNVEIVQALLAKGADIEARDSAGQTALIAAASRATLKDANDKKLSDSARGVAEQKQNAVVCLLLEHGANVQAADTFQQTALAGATKQDNKEMAQLLLDRGANPNVPFNDKMDSPMLQAVAQDDLALVKMLLQKGARLELPDTVSPLMMTTKPEMIKFLLDHGADIHACELRGRFLGTTPLMNAASTDQLQAIALLLDRGADINQVDRPGLESGQTALMWAAKYGSIETVRYLLDHGAKINMRGRKGTALMWTIDQGKSDNAHLLMQRGADLNIPDEDGMTLLMQVVQLGDIEFARELLRRGANVNAKDKNGQTALHLAAGHNDSVAKLLIKWGANVNAKDNEGNTPF